MKSARQINLIKLIDVRPYVRTSPALREWNGKLERYEFNDAELALVEQEIRRHLPKYKLKALAQMGGVS